MVPEKVVAGKGPEMASEKLGRGNLESGANSGAISSLNLNDDSGRVSRDRSKGKGVDSDVLVKDAAMEVILDGNVVSSRDFGSKSGLDMGILFC